MPRKPFRLILNDFLNNLTTKINDSVEEIQIPDGALVRRDVATLRETEDANSWSGVSRYVIPAYPTTTYVFISG
jgi:hypothetical protein